VEVECEIGYLRQGRRERLMMARETRAQRGGAASDVHPVAAQYRERMRWYSQTHLNSADSPVRAQARVSDRHDWNQAQDLGGARATSEASP